MPDFEDALAGIKAAKAAKMLAIGIGDNNILVGADIVIPGFVIETPDVLLKRLLNLKRHHNR